MQYETCRHIKEDGICCGSPALKDRKYCRYHLRDRGRRLRRARALRDNVPYRLELPPLEDLAAVQVALSEIVQALGSGQLDHRAAGKMLYAIQQTTSVIKFRVKFEAAQSEAAKTANDAARVHDYPAFEQEFGLDPGADIDAETAWTVRQAEEEAELRRAEEPPAPPPGMRLGSAQYRIYREEVYQGLNIRINKMKHDLRDYHEQKRKENEKLAKEAMSADGPHQPSVGKCTEEPSAHPPFDENYEKLHRELQNAHQQLREQEQKTKEKKKAAASVTPVPDRSTGSA